MLRQPNRDEWRKRLSGNVRPDPTDRASPCDYCHGPISRVVLAQDRNRQWRGYSLCYPCLQALL
jgi:hypothetical protein